MPVNVNPMRITLKISKSPTLTHSYCKGKTAELSSGFPCTIFDHPYSVPSLGLGLVQARRVPSSSSSSCPRFTTPADLQFSSSIEVPCTRSRSERSIAASNQDWTAPSNFGVRLSGVENREEGPKHVPTEEENTYSVLFS